MVKNRYNNSMNFLKNISILFLCATLVAPFLDDGIDLAEDFEIQTQANFENIDFGDMNPLTEEEEEENHSLKSIKFCRFSYTIIPTPDSLGLQLKWFYLVLEDQDYHPTIHIPPIA